MPASTSLTELVSELEVVQSGMTISTSGTIASGLSFNRRRRWVVGFYQNVMESIDENHVSESTLVSWAMETQGR